MVPGPLPPKTLWFGSLGRPSSQVSSPFMQDSKGVFLPESLLSRSFSQPLLAVPRAVF